MTRTADPLVGRQGELDQLLALTTGDEPVVVVGDAGVGKTRLVAEVASHLRRRGRQVAAAACLPLAAPLPLLPIVDVLKTLLGRDGQLPGSTVLESCPAYVRDELARLLPELGATAAAPAISGQDWQQQRLFAALLDLCRGVTTSRSWTMVVEDVHWSDSTTRDFLTYLLGHRIPGMSVLLTARRADLEAGEAADWLRNLRSAASLTELDLGPLSRQEVHELASTIRGSPLPQKTLADLYRRAEGNAFFTEQLLAAQEFESAAGLPEGLAQLLRARVSDLHPASRRVLEALAVAARPLPESELVQITGNEPTENRRALRDLLTRQLIRTEDGIAFTTKHALLGEAVAETLLPGERAELSGSMATMLLGRGDPALAGEAADHLAHAGRPDAEFDARVAAAEYAESMGAFATAAQNWERATALAELQPNHRARVGELALRTMIAWDYSGDIFRGEAWGRRGMTAARAQGQRPIEAALLTRLATIHHVVDKETGRSEYRKAIDLFEGLPPSAEAVQALHLLYQSYDSTGQHQEGRPYLERAIAMGEDQRFGNELVPALLSLAYEHFYAGDLARGMASYERARTLAESLNDAHVNVWLAIAETDLRLKLNMLEEAVRVGERELLRLQTQGLGDASIASIVIFNTVQAFLELGRVDDAEEIVDRVTQDSWTPRIRWHVEEARSRIDLAHARLDAAAARVAAILALKDQRGTEFGSELGEHRAELALWQGRPEAALEVVHSDLGMLRGTEDERYAARLLVLGMRACADVAAAQNTNELRGDQTAGQEFVRALAQMAVDPFGFHAYFVAAVADGADWRAETERAHGRDEPNLWEAAAVCWDELGRPHRAAYARWRQAEALLRNGDRRPAAACLRVAWRQAEQHLPLRNQLSSLARMARIDLNEPSEPVIERPAQPTPYGLTERELDVLRLLVHGLTNSEIGARLYISPKTASVHVTSILRKLEATNRVHAAAIAQRTGLIEP